MSRTLVETLKSIPRALASPYVFTMRQDEQYGRFNSTSWRKAVRLAGIAPIRWHDLRHTFGSRLAQAGVSLTTIKELMGHKTIQVTMRYAHLAPSNMHDAVKVLDRKPMPALRLEPAEERAPKTAT
jgi:integrase